MSSTDSRPTIVLIHGFWVTPRSWEHWIPYYEQKGYKVIAPAYPGFEAEVESLRADPSPIEHLEVPEIIAKLEGIIRELDQPPILMGHSAGGVMVQLLLDKGLGACGVAMNSAPTEGVVVVPLTQLKSTFPVLKNPANRNKAVGFTHEQWHYAFTNTFTDADSKAMYDRYHVPASGHVLFGSILANFIPGPQETYVDYHNESRPPLLFISGGSDNLMPPAVQRSNAAHYKGKTTLTEIKEFEGRAHLMPAEKGWHDVADYALAWAEKQVRS
ncbi:MAG: alpha/beta hydrolase [Gemmatimonadaceae bacterium]|nr:alpha/beta hydrolase [Gemmatimonadaceae bacterium]